MRPFVLTQVLYMLVNVLIVAKEVVEWACHFAHMFPNLIFVHILSNICRGFMNLPMLLLILLITVILKCKLLLRVSSVGWIWGFNLNRFIIHLNCFFLLFWGLLEVDYGIWVFLGIDFRWDAVLQIWHRLLIYNLLMTLIMVLLLIDITLIIILINRTISIFSRIN